MLLTQAHNSLEPLTTSTWNWQGHQIQYTRSGKGMPLLLIHGFGASLGHWRKNIPVLAQQGYEVFAIDLLGFGWSDKPALNYSLELWQQQLKAFWEEQIQKPTIFVGNSIGGVLSLMMLADYPELAVGGILLNCAGGLNHRPEELNFPLRMIMGAFTKLVSSPIIGKFLFNQIRQKHRIRRTLYQVYSDRQTVTDELVDLLYQPSCDPGAQQVFSSILTAPAGPTPKSLLERVKAPLLVIWGENDPWTPISGSTIYQELAKNDPLSQFQAIANTGHCPHDEKPEQVNALILQWLTQFT
jgi:pimeloyl-ACP methyl ester carboxylesterase